MVSTSRLANDTWEAFFRAQATIALEFTNADIWADLLPREYGVLHALSNAPRGLRITELGDDALLTQPGMSRLIARLEKRGLVERGGDEHDARASRIRLTPAGADAQRRVGSAHAQHITRAMTRALDRDQLIAMRDLSLSLLAAAEHERKHS